MSIDIDRKRASARNRFKKAGVVSTNNRPFPDELLIACMADTGMTDPDEVRAFARSTGWVEVPGGWRTPIQ